MEEKFGIYDYTKMKRRSYFRPNGDLNATLSHDTSKVLVPIEEQPAQSSSYVNLQSTNDDTSIPLKAVI